MRLYDGDLVTLMLAFDKLKDRMDSVQPKGFQFSEIRFSNIQDGGRPPSWISMSGYNFGIDQHFGTKFSTEMENRQPNGFQYSEIRFSKIQDGGRPPSWISIFGHNFGVDQHFCAKFGTRMENHQTNGTHC